jgi:hypothetical protein
VPHHGSRNAHNQDVWNLMLEASPVAVVTPYTGGTSPLPTVGDQKRLVRLTTNRAYSTALSGGWSASRKGQPADRENYKAKAPVPLIRRSQGTFACVADFRGVRVPHRDV